MQGSDPQAAILCLSQGNHVPFVLDLFLLHGPQEARYPDARRDFRPYGWSSGRRVGDRSAERPTGDRRRRNGNQHAGHFCPRYTDKLSYSKEEWEQLPEDLTLRQIKVTVPYPGFRVQHFYIVTTLLDAARYTAGELADLYFQRWDVELFFRDIKTTMGMDVLRCQTPDMIRKEVLMHFIAYNCIRRLMGEAAKATDLAVRLVSFKGSLQALRNWEPHLNQGKLNRTERARLIADLHEAITDTPIRQRPGRSEPRCRKRRAKNYELMTRPRHEMKETPHRNRYRAEAA
ncbi:transposase [Geoalkalibacter sp.]|uniref:transposase n=1 Tax=Geoalkalibacter sp. TaxID=3041440 RepID=UPI003FA5400F